jgi:hypothetical protein
MHQLRILFRQKIFQRGQRWSSLSLLRAIPYQSRQFTLRPRLPRPLLRPGDYDLRTSVEPKPREMTLHRRNETRRKSVRKTMRDKEAASGAAADHGGGETEADSLAESQQAPQVAHFPRPHQLVSEIYSSYNNCSRLTSPSWTQWSPKWLYVHQRSEIWNGRRIVFQVGCQF